MSDTIQQYKDYVITSFMKAVQPVVVASAEGAVVHDASGKDYLDCFAGIAVVNAGHCNPKVIAAAKAQMDKLVHCASYIYHSPATGELPKSWRRSCLHRDCVSRSSPTVEPKPSRAH